MTIHYHGTPITPSSTYEYMGGRHYCVSFMRPDDVKRAHAYGQSVLLDNGAYSAWKQGFITDWPGYYEWCDFWLDYPTTWAIIPDVITGKEEEQDQLIAQWPFAQRGAPVWHLHESLERLLRLTETWGKVCMGSSGQYNTVLSLPWKTRMDAAWDLIERRHARTPWIHMLRGMQVVKYGWPFASVDSTDVARNHSRPTNRADHMADRWDRMQCPPKRFRNLGSIPPWLKEAALKFGWSPKK